MRYKFCILIALFIILASSGLGQSRVINFSGYDWVVKEELNKNPGPNNWSSSIDSVYVDEQGQLHLKIMNKDGIWYCSSLHLKSSLGYGTYEFSIVTKDLDPNVVAGLFVYESDSKEIDIEVSRWRNPNAHNLHYTVQPDNSDELHLNLQDGDSLHTLIWSPEEIKFKSEQNNNIVGEWNYLGEDNFAPGKESVHINFWLSKGTPPAENQELIIKSFKFSPLTTNEKVVVDNQSTLSKWQLFLNKIKKLFKL